MEVIKRIKGNAPHTLAPQHARCLRCNHALRATEGPYGPTCHRRILAAAKVLWDSGHPVARRAATLLLDGDIRSITTTASPTATTARKTRTNARNVFSTPSKDGTTTYLITPTTCGCLAGQHDKLCCHRVAVIVLVGM